MNAAQRFFVRVGALAGKETIHIRRDPQTLAIALLMPMMLLLLFGFGVSFDMDHIPVAVVDLDHTETSRLVARELYASNELVRPSAQLGRALEEDDLRTPDRAAELLRVNEAAALVVLPKDLGRDLQAGVAVQLTIDGRDGTTANQVQAKTEQILRRISGKLVDQPSPPLAVDVWTRFNPEARSPLFLVPGLAAYVMAIVAVLLTALTIATEWERGSMEQLFASPVGRLEIILGKLLPYLCIGLMQLLLVLVVGTWVFEVPVRGSMALLMGAGLVFLIGMLGQGLLISVIAKNQMVATQAGALTSLVPSLLLSGMVFPVENMPTILQWISMALPARHMVTAMRGIMLKGSTLDQLWPDFLSMAVFGLVMLVAATGRFQRKLA